MILKKVIAIKLFLFVIAAGLYAQQGISLELNSDYLTVPLTEADVQSKSGGFLLGYRFNERFNVGLGIENRLLLDGQSSGFESKSGLGVGVDYRLWSFAAHSSSLDLNIKLVKGWSQLMSSSDISAGAGLRWYVFDSFFVGTGLRYDKWMTDKKVVNPEPTLNWYWQLGMRFTLSKKQ
jgi:long-subunit fatty acid transport protein